MTQALPIPFETPAFDPATRLPLRRPRLLLCAARHGLAEYRRERDLARILALAEVPRRVVEALAEAEAAQEVARRAGATGYSCLRHVEVLIALLAELRLCAKS